MGTWLYLPAAGAALVIGEGLERFIHHCQSRRILSCAVLIAFVLFMSLNVLLMRHKARCEIRRALFIENLVFQIHQRLPEPPSDNRIYLNIKSRPVVFGWPGALKISYGDPALEIIHTSSPPQPDQPGSTVWYFEVDGMAVHDKSIKGTF
ncbi:hypothetical protein ACFLU6_07145 [Acidobacteriota bacterium]